MKSSDSTHPPSRAAGGEARWSPDRSGDAPTHEKIVVLGLGLFGGGLGAARWALARGARVVVTDLRQREELEEPLRDLEPFAATAAGELELVLGEHRERDFEDASMVIVNPAVPPTARPVALARSAGAEITTAIALFLRESSCRVIGITGTNGKSSTTHFLRQLLRLAPAGAGRVVIGGNFGGSLLESAAELGSEDIAVLELSSYQLEHLPPSPPRRLAAAVVTTIGVDHLERHGTVERYRAAKMRLFELLEQEHGLAALGSDVGEADVRAVAGSRPRVHRLGAGPNDLSVAHGTPHAITAAGTHLGDGADLRPLGSFQRRNLALALAAAHGVGSDPKLLAAAVRRLDGLPHRLHDLGCFTTPNGTTVRVVDNGVSTAPSSTESAMEAVAELCEGPPPIVLVGGQQKSGHDFEGVARIAARDGWAIAPFGASAPLVGRAAKDAGAAVIEATGARLESAVEAVLGAAGDGAVVLFSPACASFDAFQNFRDRAEGFQALLRNWTRRTPEQEMDH